MAADNESPKVSIVISNFNGENLLQECLDSLARLNYTNYEVVVVDAGSADRSRELIRELYPWVRLVGLKDRCGVGEALNKGINASVGELIVIDYNVDETAEPDWLDHLVTVLKEYEGQKVLVGGTRLLHGSGGLVDDLGMNYYHPFGVATKRYHGRPLKDCPKDRTQEVHYLNMFAMWRHTYEELGPLDENVFFWGEDAEYCLRAHRRGYRMLVVPKAITWHKVSSTVTNHPERQAYYLRKSMLYLVLKHYPWYFLPFGLASNGFIFFLDLLLLVPFVSKILSKTRYPMFSRRRGLNEIWASLRALAWIIAHLPRILSARHEQPPRTLR